MEMAWHGMCGVVSLAALRPVVLLRLHLPLSAPVPVLVGLVGRSLKCLRIGTGEGG